MDKKKSLQILLHMVLASSMPCLTLFPNGVGQKLPPALSPEAFLKLPKFGANKRQR